MNLQKLSNVLALTEPYAAVMIVSLIVFAGLIGALYLWTRSRATNAPIAHEPGPLPPDEAHYR